MKNIGLKLLVSRAPMIIEHNGSVYDISVSGKQLVIKINSKIAYSLLIKGFIITPDAVQERLMQAIDDCCIDDLKFLKNS